MILTQFNLIKEDLLSIENKVAELEHRKLRDIFQALVSPRTQWN